MARIKGNLLRKNNQNTKTLSERKEKAKQRDKQRDDGELENLFVYWKVYDFLGDSPAKNTRNQKSTNILGPNKQAKALNPKGGDAAEIKKFIDDHHLEVIGKMIRSLGYNISL